MLTGYKSVKIGLNILASPIDAFAVSPIPKSIAKIISLYKGDISFLANEISRYIQPTSDIEIVDLFLNEFTSVLKLTNTNLKTTLLPFVYLNNENIDIPPVSVPIINGLFTASLSTVLELYKTQTIFPPPNLKEFLYQFWGYLHNFLFQIQYIPIYSLSKPMPFPVKSTVFPISYFFLQLKNVILDITNIDSILSQYPYGFPLFAIYLFNFLKSTKDKLRIFKSILSILGIDNYLPLFFEKYPFIKQLIDRPLPEPYLTLSTNDQVISSTPILQEAMGRITFNLLILLYYSKTNDINNIIYLPPNFSKQIPKQDIDIILTELSSSTITINYPLIKVLGINQIKLLLNKKTGIFSEFFPINSLDIATKNNTPILSAILYQDIPFS